MSKAPTTISRRPQPDSAAATCSRISAGEPRTTPATWAAARRTVGSGSSRSGRTASIGARRQWYRADSRTFASGSASSSARTSSGTGTNMPSQARTCRSSSRARAAHTSSGRGSAFRQRPWTSGPAATRLRTHGSGSAASRARCAPEAPRPTAR
ncbi:hypothetical protein ACF1HG_19515 [Streptomyces globisporus]|uniref:hypothetical protein n=1 Tax=Streptomyces globisporus TaxID=1908 RepID=UPI0036FA346A